MSEESTRRAREPLGVSYLSMVSIDVLEAVEKPNP
jgi:hypothetical protein